MPNSAANLQVLTIGHSTRPLEEFIAILQGHSVTLVADVRTVPRSRQNSQFNRKTLPVSLKVAGTRIIYPPLDETSKG
jgi:uncharacterized protein (DUF488 family)